MFAEYSGIAHNPAFEVPRGSGKHSIYAGALWLGGKDTNGQLYVAIQAERQFGDAGYWPGPVGTVQGPNHNAVYDRIWKVSKAQIQQHKAHFFKSWYVMPADILEWPGNGNTANGEAAKLAPFVDLNNDGIYSPQLGEYPDIKGDQALYLILNDKGNVKQLNTPTMNAEIHVMYYGYDNTANSPVYYTVFSEYRIINRGQFNLHDFYAGLWMDFDLGLWSDDFIGCDTLTNRFYIYNGDNDDEGITGYGLNPPVQSAMFLDQKMSHFLYYNHDQNVVNGFPYPTNVANYYNYLRGVWLNNAAVTYGGDGTNQNNKPVNYMFPGDPVTQQGWSERNIYDTQNPVSNVPYDRRGIGSIGPFNLNAGQELKFTVAYTFSQGTSNLNSITKAQQDAGIVQNFFRAANVLSTQTLTPEKQQLIIQPNPATDYISIALPAAFRNNQTSVTISDYVGKALVKKNLKGNVSESSSINIAALSKGIYFVTVTSGAESITQKLVKL